ncbi:MAG TPA: hypothetical protein VID03_06360 [Acidimicrobiia bacterium]|jgi:ADP-ribose pyrophosphatase YjhB (NUDIX family)
MSVEVRGAGQPALVAAAVVFDRFGRVMLSHLRQVDLWAVPEVVVRVGELPQEALRVAVRDWCGLGSRFEELAGAFVAPDGRLVLAFRCGLDDGVPVATAIADIHLMLPVELGPINVSPRHMHLVREVASRRSDGIVGRLPGPPGPEFLRRLRQGERQWRRPRPSADLGTWAEDVLEQLSLASGGDRVPLLIRLGELLAAAGEDEASSRTFQSAVTLSERLGERRLQIDATLKRDAATDLSAWQWVDELTAQQETANLDLPFRRLADHALARNRAQEAEAYGLRAVTLTADPQLAAGMRRRLESRLYGSLEQAG